jgi:hypothetical protein
MLGGLVVKRFLFMSRSDALIVGSTLIWFIFLATTPNLRVGDGSEYIAMFLAITQEHVPWMDSGSWNTYSNLVASGKIPYLVDSAALMQAFPELSAIPGQWDFNHFWFYSACAAAVSFFLSILGLGTSPIYGFLGLHFVLTVMLLVSANRKFGILGLASALLLIFASPLMWFTNKIHTEYFTVSLVGLAVISILSNEFMKATIFLAIASTQNPSFAIVAATVVLLSVSNSPSLFRSLRFYVHIFIIAIIAALHPTYYYLRYGAFTPQSLAGGLELGSNLDSIFVWIMDPDIGLLFNWPILTLILSLFTYFLLKSKKSQFQETFRVTPRLYSLFLISFVVISLFAQSSTTNLNSGATPGIARYALWYIFLFFPIAILALKEIFTMNSSKIYGASAAVFLPLLLISFVDNNPLKNESYTNPSAPSLFIQTFLSPIYSPPAEIFAERFSGMGESIWMSEFTGVIGPDCNKVLIIKASDVQNLSNRFGCSNSLEAQEELEASSRGITALLPKYYSIKP